jgi:hypothetical protein
VAFDEILSRIRALMRRNRYRLSLHAERERDADRIAMSELEEALSSEGLELLEDYPEDPRGHSHLVLGFTRMEQPIHAVCAVHEGMLVIVTVYSPDPKLWQDYRTRKEKT